VQTEIFLYKAVVGRLKMEVVLYTIVFGVQLAADATGGVEVYGTLEVVVPEYEYKADHFQQQKQKEVEIPP
jgi:hypothetical protein